MLECINTFDQISLIYRMCFKFENLIFQRGPQQTYLLECLSNVFWIQNFIFHRGALTMIIVQMYIKCTVFFLSICHIYVITDILFLMNWCRRYVRFSNNLELQSLGTQWIQFQFSTYWWRTTSSLEFMASDLSNSKH